MAARDIGGRPLKTHYRVVIIGGGIVGASVLYHLTRGGWHDVALIERAELTAGSTWHAAAGFHAQNHDSNIAALQAYTIALYPEIERESGQSVGMRKAGGFSLAGSKERFESLKAEWAHFQSLGHPTELVTPAEIAARCPIVDVSEVYGGLWDPNEGHMDPHGTTHAYAGAARKRGGEVILHNRVLSLTPLPSGEWRVETEKGVITAGHVVNAAGLWARRVGRMAGLNLPVTPMQHHYLLTEDVPELAALSEEMPAVTDLEGYTYLQQERKGVLLGIYELNPRHWNVEGAPWDYGMELIPEEIDRIADELTVGLNRFPALQRVGIRKWVNGAFTFTPDGNPLVGPVPGLRNYWVACGVMAGFSQGGGVGLSLANWMIDGDPGADIFGMDIARYGAFAANDRYLRARTRQFYARRFVLSHPNEELPAGRPLKTSPSYDVLTAAGARFGVSWGMEFPQYFATGEPGFVETPSQRRSDAERFVAAEVRATRSAAGLWETAIYARYRVTGPGARAWLDHLLASKLPAPGRVRLATMLKRNGNLAGDLTVMQLEDGDYWIVGSYYLQAWHWRWFQEHLPASGVVLENVSDVWTGFSLSGPRSRDILASLTGTDVSNAALPFMAATHMEVGATNAIVARLSLTGELGYEITVPAAEQRALWHALAEAGAPHGMCQLGGRALECLRIEKGYGIWSMEFTQAYTPSMCGLDRYIDRDKGDFIGRAALLAAPPPAQRLAMIEIDAVDADARGFEPIWVAEKIVGYVTSGAYGHHVGKSLALAYLDVAVIDAASSLTVHVVGERRTARLLGQPPYDPSGSRLRG